MYYGNFSHLSPSLDREVWQFPLERKDKLAVYNFSLYTIDIAEYSPIITRKVWDFVTKVGDSASCS